MKKNISVLILTFNEELHIERCIKSLLPFTKEIFLVDSFSTDTTVEIAESLGAKVFQNKWTNYAVQYQWGLDNCPIDTEWVMRMDADEYILQELEKEISKKLESIEDVVSGIYIKRRVYFKDKWIKHGGYYPIWLLRIWRYKDGHIEQRWMDEHIKLTSGKTTKFENDLIDDNLNDLSWWIQKHNNYATREAIDILNIIYDFKKHDGVEPNLIGTQEQRRRWLKIRYASMPLFLRPILYFIWRYFLKLGFLDGKSGLIWHFLQGFWYRFLVDAKINEIYLKTGKDRDAILEYLKVEHGVEF
jgi:glycosyltransferase involved in cell wall biosynthesis